jgi:hypothetical protein
MAAGDLTTAAEVIAYLQTRPNISIDPALIAQLITNASAFIKTYCSDNFVSQEYTELRDGDMSGRVSWGSSGYGWATSRRFDRGIVRYVTAFSPITAVSSVTVNGTAISSAGNPPYTQGYIFDKTKIVLLGLYVPPVPNCVQLVYTAGYVDVPADINQACIDIVALKYVQRRRLGVASEAMSGVGSRTYITNADMPADTRRDLDQRKRVAPVGNVISP